MKTILLNEHWKFHYGDCPEAWYKGYDTSSWTDITIPHDWSVSMPFSKEYSSGTGYLAGGIGWYQTTFFLPESYKNKKIWIVFDGVYKNSQVWVNSYYQGKRPYGYSSFSYDISDFVSYGENKNVIAVKVDHTDISDSRWFTGSGITRKVSLLIKDAVYIKKDSVFFTTPMVNTSYAAISIETICCNDTDAPVQITLQNKLKDTNHTVVLSLETHVTLAPHQQQSVTQTGELTTPNLWSPNTPYLYTLMTSCFTQEKKNTYQDTQEQKVGIRSFYFDAKKGFFFNDTNVTLKGVCIHHDAGCLGAAVLPEIWLRRLLKLKDMGCNAIRMSHNPHMPELYDLCDALGFFVMDEAFDEWENAKNKWSTGHNVYPPKHQGYFEDFPAWHKIDLEDFIRRNRNHPSIIMWSIGNEIDYPNDPYCHPFFTSMVGNNDKNKPEKELQYNPDKPNMERLTVLANSLTSIVKSLDITRPVTAAVAFPELSTYIGYIDSFDVVGYNYKEQFYEQDHKRFPDKPFLGSETSHSYSAWCAVTDNDYISGQFLWTGIDYLGEAHGWPIHGSSAGLLTLAGFEKTGYYRRQSLWSEKPMIYMVTTKLNHSKKGLLNNTNDREWKPVFRNFNYLLEEQIEIRCYTNLPEIELFLGSQSLGKKEKSSEIEYISYEISYQPETLKAMGTNDFISIMDSLTPSLFACQIIATPFQLPDTFDLTCIEHINTQSLIQIEIIVADCNRHCVTNSTPLLSVSVEGGILIGLENGDLSDVTEYTASYRRAYEGKLIAYVKKQAETIKVTIEGENLSPAILHL